MATSQGRTGERKAGAQRGCLGACCPPLQEEAWWAGARPEQRTPQASGLTEVREFAAKKSDHHAHSQAPAARSLQAAGTRHFPPGLQGLSGYSRHPGGPGVQTDGHPDRTGQRKAAPGPPSSGGRSLRSHVGATGFALTSCTSEGARGGPQLLARRGSAQSPRQSSAFYPLPWEPRHNPCRPSRLPRPGGPPPGLPKAGVLKGNFRSAGLRRCSRLPCARASGPSSPTSPTLAPSFQQGHRTLPRRPAGAGGQTAH